MTNQLGVFTSSVRATIKLSMKNQTLFPERVSLTNSYEGL